MLEKIKKFNWLKFVFPFTTYYKLKFGYINPVLVLVDIIILCIPFGTILTVIIVNLFVNDLNEGK